MTRTLALLAALALLGGCTSGPAPRPVVSTIAEPLDAGPPDPAIVPLTREQEDQAAR